MSQFFFIINFLINIKKSEKRLKQWLKAIAESIKNEEEENELYNEFIFDPNGESVFSSESESKMKQDED